MSAQVASRSQRWKVLRRSPTFWVGGSIVAKGVQDPRINDDVRLVHSLGGYHDAFELLASMTLGKFRAEDEWVDWEPSNVTIRVVRNSILPALPREDHEALWHLFTQDEGEIPDGLTAEGEALARVLVNRDPERVPELMADLPDELTELMQAISPSHGIENLVANTLLLHDKYDYVLPYGESVRFYHDLRSAERTHLTLLEVFHHVRPDEEGGYLELVRDATRLYRHVYLMHRPLDDRGWFTWPPGLAGNAPCPEQVDSE
jgi:hypothetical protein